MAFRDHGARPFRPHLECGTSRSEVFHNRERPFSEGSGDEPIRVEAGRGSKVGTAVLTRLLEEQAQALLDNSRSYVDAEAVKEG